MGTYIRYQDMDEAQIRKELDEEFAHWDYMYRFGCQDPFWPDGVNLNLTRNHIIYWYEKLKDKIEGPVQLTLFGGADLSRERPVPPEVPDDYMAPQGGVPESFV